MTTLGTTEQRDEFLRQQRLRIARSSNFEEFPRMYIDLGRYDQVTDTADGRTFTIVRGLVERCTRPRPPTSLPSARFIRGSITDAPVWAEVRTDTSAKPNGHECRSRRCAPERKSHSGG